ncbi:SigE family RNA polymerase sigma factor [Dactylosporangium siamense]|uniref:RNA polymerase sigma24 factor n=1 Tax=Dactylosporangium siamense TaxID=685454 RepID=A0A919PSR9_9ACTN|nr:SigE family RNA polymerase sigma factor [Dactylosporangium siamense]GIG49514.1 RNA polymerase sigma24 factor [Dactylosporangium siamense]
MATDVEGYREYVTGRLPALRRVAYLLCGDWHTADDVLSATLVRLLLHWPKVSAADNVDAYVRRVLVRTMLNERRRPWRRERTLAALPEPAPVPGGSDAVDERVSLLALLDELPARRRAVVVLRYCCDLSVEETARELGCSPGTVKSQAARALDTLRERLSVQEESPWTS